MVMVGHSFQSGHAMTMLTERNAVGPAVPSAMRKAYVADLSARFSFDKPKKRSGQLFRQRVEAHIHDVKQGHGWRSVNVNSELRSQHQQNEQILADIDPTSLSMYVGLISGMDYNQQARLASAVFSMNQDLDVLVDAGRQLDMLRQARIDRYA